MWQSGAGIAGDAAGNAYFFTGNGDFTANTGGVDYGDSLVKLNPAANPLVVDRFTPYNQSTLDGGDLDLGSGAPLLIGSNLVVGGGKDGQMYVTRQSNLGHFNPSGDTQIVQSWQASNSTSGSARISGGPVYWVSPVGGLLYIWPSHDFLKGNLFCVDSGALSLSSNGTLSGTGILWANLPSSGSFNIAPAPGVLRAFDATNLTNELWDSNQNAARDAIGTDAKYVPPTVVNGKVYMATFSGTLNVYGLLHPGK